MADEGEHTKVHHLRATRALWAAYGSVCRRVYGKDRAPVLIDHMRRIVATHGNDEEKALLAQDRAETKARRSRKGGRPSRRDQ